jgi:hypothetical protein
MDCGIDDETIEQYALGKLKDADPWLVTHLPTCVDCLARIKEAREWAHHMKLALERDC